MSSFTLVNFDYVASVIWSRKAAWLGFLQVNCLSKVLFIIPYIMPFVSLPVIGLLYTAEFQDWDNISLYINDQINMNIWRTLTMICYVCVCSIYIVSWSRIVKVYLKWSEALLIFSFSVGYCQMLWALKNVQCSDQISQWLHYHTT